MVVARNALYRWRWSLELAGAAAATAAVLVQLGARWSGPAALRKRQDSPASV